jgi:hypothetical protein
MAEKAKEAPQPAPAMEHGVAETFAEPPPARSAA